jgi:V/A-type H+/Na+-transporting ATPase subunit K
MKRKIAIAALAALIALAAAAILPAQAASDAAGAALSASDSVAIATVKAKASSDIWKYISAAVAVSAACIGGGLAVGQIGSAAMGAMSENAELSGKAIPFAGLAEGVCLWGFLVALLLILV